MPSPRTTARSRGLALLAPDQQQSVTHHAFPYKTPQESLGTQATFSNFSTSASTWLPTMLARIRTGLLRVQGFAVALAHLRNRADRRTSTYRPARLLQNNQHWCHTQHLCSLFIKENSLIATSKTAPWVQQELNQPLLLWKLICKYPLNTFNTCSLGVTIKLF